MKICIISEGCYPYIAGGVSSWVQMLIEGMPEHEFIIVTIGAEKKDKGKFKYTLPKNVIEVHENFLDEFFEERISKGINYKLCEEERNQIVNLFIGRKVNWNIIFKMFKKDGPIKANEFLCSNEFLDIVRNLCAEKYDQLPFTDVFWTIRSMLIPILNIFRCSVPEADIYHSVSTGYAGIIAAKFKEETQKPFILTEHGIYTREREEEILKASWVDSYFKQIWIQFFLSISQGAYDAADVITSLFVKAKQIQNELGADPKKCIVLPNGVSTSRFNEIGPILNHEQDEIIIGAILRVVPIKDVKTLIYSFDIVKQKVPNAKLYIIGPTDEDEEYYQECIDLIKSLRCKDIVFTGRVNIEDWMKKIDIVILTSISEGQPFVLLEAMSAKRPVIATDVGSCREIIEGADDEFGNCGIVVPVMNPDKIAYGIVKMIKNKNEMIKMAEEGYKRVCKYYEKGDFLKKYKDLYRSVVKDGRSRV